MGGFTNKQINKQTNRQIDKQKSKQIDKRTKRQKDKKTKRQKDKKTKRQKDKKKKRKKDKKTRQTDKYSNRQTDKCRKCNMFPLFFCFWVAKVKQGVISRFTRCVSLHPSVSLGSCPINVPHVPSTTKSLLFRYPKDEFCQKEKCKKNWKG